MDLHPHPLQQADGGSAARGHGFDAIGPKVCHFLLGIVSAARARACGSASQPLPNPC